MNKKKKRRGRPPLTEEEKKARDATPRNLKRPRPEQRRRCQTPDAKARKVIVDGLLQEAEQKDGASKPMSFWFDLQEKYGLPVAMLKRMASSAEREKLERFLALQDSKLKPQGRSRYWRRFISQDTGCRLAKNGSVKKTFQSPLREEEAILMSWARRTSEVGDELSVYDLQDEFVLLLDSVVWELETKLEDEGSLPPPELAKLRTIQHRLKKRCDG